jgi:hypothetical protein
MATNMNRQLRSSSLRMGHGQTEDHCVKLNSRRPAGRIRASTNATSKPTTGRLVDSTVKRHLIDTTASVESGERATTTGACTATTTEHRTLSNEDSKCPEMPRRHPRQTAARRRPGKTRQSYDKASCD